MHKPHLLVLSAALAFAGCGACQSPVEDPGSTVPGQCQTDQPLIEPQKLDILFVIDNSGSMQDEQEKVAHELTAFIDEVRRGGGVAQDFRVGVITTSVYRHSLINNQLDFRTYDDQAGKLQAVPDAAPDGGVVLGTGTERMLTGEDPSLVEKFSRLVRQGINGSGQETPFEAVRLALTGHLAQTSLDQGGNGGFLRDRARLLIVVVSDEDDCSETARPSVVTVGTDPSRDYCTEQTNSLTTVERYHEIFTQELRDSTGAQREVVWAVIGPVGQTNKQAQGIIDQGTVRNVDCPTSYQPGYRQRRMAELFDPQLANLDSICKASYRETLVAIAGLANISQTLEVQNVPDPRLLQVTIIRRDDSPQVCTLSNEGLTAFDPAAVDQPARVHFGGACVRRADDKEVQIRMFCAG